MNLSNWLLGIGITLLVLGLIYVLSVLGMFRFLMGKPKRSTKVPDFYVGSPHYKVSRAGMALMKTYREEDAYIESFDGLRLHALVYPLEDHPKKFVLGIHGYRSYPRPEFGPYIEWYRSLGYSMVLPDDRAHRPSEGSYIGFGVLDRLDCVAWAKWIRDTYGEDVEILLHGVSMGGATVLAASGEEALPSQVMGVVADCGYSSAWEILNYQIGKAMHLPSGLVLPLMEKFCKLLAHYDFHSFTPLEQVKKARVPILFVHGAEDKMVPAWMVDSLYEACTSRKEKMVVENAGHAESIALEPDRYHETVRSFFHI